MLRGTEWEVIYSDELRIPYYLAADNAYTASEPLFTISVLGSGVGAEQPAELQCTQTVGGAAAEADVVVQRTVKRFRIKERIPVSSALTLESPHVRELMPRFIAEALEIVDILGTTCDTTRVRTKDGWITANAACVEALADGPSRSGDSEHQARAVASPFKLRPESELTATAATVCSTPNTRLLLTELNERRGGCLMGDCVLTTGHLFVRPFATHPAQDLVFALALVDLVEARIAGGGILGIGLTDDLRVELITADEGPDPSDVASLRFEARWEREDLLQALQRQLFVLATSALASTGSASTTASSAEVESSSDAAVKSGWMYREVGRAGGSAPWAQDYVTIDEEGILRVFESSSSGTPKHCFSCSECEVLQVKSRRKAHPNAFRINHGDLKLILEPSLDTRASEDRSQLDPNAIRETQSWIDAIFQAQQRVLQPATAAAKVVTGDSSSERSERADEESAVLRFVLTGQGEMAVNIGRHDSLDDLRLKILDSLTMTIAGTHDGSEVSLCGSDDDGSRRSPGSALSHHQLFDSIWMPAAAAGRGGLPLTLKLGASVSNPRRQLPTSDQVDAHLEEDLEQVQSIADTLSRERDAERASTLRRQIAETNQTIAMLRTIDGTATMVTDAEKQVTAYKAELALLQAAMPAVTGRASLSLEIAEEAEPPDGAGSIDVMEQLRQSQAQVSLLSRQLSPWDASLELPTFTGGDESCMELSPQMLSRLWAAIPPSLHIHAWSLVYRLHDHGASLSTLYARVTERAAEITETILLIKDTSGYVFGALAMRPWAEAERYYGLGEGMVFKCGPTAAGVGQSPSPRMRGGGSQSPSPGTRRGGQFLRFGWSRKNDMFQMATKDFLCLGGGGAGYALWIDSHLNTGTSTPCDTYNNTCLASSSKFRIAQVELWGLQML